MAKNKKRRQLEKRKIFETKKSGNEGKDNSNSFSNPFELHVNKVKHNVIGRKLGKNEFGRPGMSRNKAVKKRKETLLEEYKNKHKSGKGLQDLRIKDSEKRFTNQFTQLDRSIDLSKNDNMVLTHKGKHLNDFINDRVGSDDEDIDLFNRSEFVESAHFGGGSDGRPKSANDVLSEIMNEKREKQLENAANIELTEKLDNQWNDIRNVLRHKGVKHENTTLNEDYDILVKQLMFEDKNVDNNKPLIKQLTEKSVEKVIEVKRSADNQFKDTIEKIESETEWSMVSKLIRDLINNLLPKITKDSINLLFEKYQTIHEMKSGFTINNMAFIIIGSHFKQTKFLVQLILIELLSRLKYKTYADIGQTLAIVRLLIIASNGKYIPEVVISITNVLKLAQKENYVELTVGQKQKFKVDCILAIDSDISDKSIQNFNIKYIYDGKLSDYKSNNENNLKAMLLLEALKIVNEIHDLYSNIPSFNEIITPLKNVLSRIKSENFSIDINKSLNDLTIKLKKEMPKVSVCDSRPKPFMLPMFEPKFDDIHSNKASDKKKLTKKYKRELKGAQRELRKDSTFLRNTWINEIKTKDDHRKRKVKQLLGDLALQQGIYKKKK